MGAPITVTPVRCAHCGGDACYDTESGYVTCRECDGRGIERFELTRDGLLGSLLPSRWTAEDARHFAASIEHLDDTAAIAAIEREVAP